MRPHVIGTTKRYSPLLQLSLHTAAAHERSGYGAAFRENITGALSEAAVSAKGGHYVPDEGRKRSLEETMLRVSDSLERSKIGQYVDLMNRPGRMIYLNLMGGLFRGVGMAIGFTLLGALVVYVFTRSFLVNLPVVGKFLGDLVWIIQQNLKMRI